MAKRISMVVLNQNGEELEKKVNLNGDVFGIEPNTQVMFDAVQVYQANKRQATAKTKTRAEVRGGGKKPWRQKGTGRARAGSSRSPIWVGGGTVFGPIGNQNFKLKMNKKSHALALKSALWAEDEGDKIFYERYLELVEADEHEYQDIDIMLFTILELAGSTGYNSILFEEPVSIEKYKPFLYRTVRLIIQSHRK